jgi:hypothetical protein
MRMRLLLSAAAAAISLLTDQSVRAQPSASVGCVGHEFTFVRDGVTHLDGYARAGRPCQIRFGGRGSVVALQITVRPARGILGVSEKEGQRQYVAYVPQEGFAGQDRFEIYLRYIGEGGTNSYFTLVKVEMNVTP